LFAAAIDGNGADARTHADYQGRSFDPGCGIWRWRALEREDLLKSFLSIHGPQIREAAFFLSCHCSFPVWIEVCAHRPKGLLCALKTRRDTPGWQSQEKAASAITGRS
jgi:hypothetical protein